MKKTYDMTTGSIMKAIIVFALPILLGNLFQQAYNIVDAAIAGHLLGDDALAAIGSTAPLYNLLMYFIGGFNGGFALVIGKYFGMSNRDRLKDSIAAMIAFNAVITVIVMALSLVVIKPILTLLNIPDDVFNDAYRYVIVVFFGCAITSAYNAQANMLRAMGNSVIPIVFLIVSSVLNIGLDMLFIAVFKLGVMGASLATMASQMVSVVLCFITIHRNYRDYRVSKSNFKFDKDLYSEMFSAGITMALMNCIFAIGSLILQGAINGLGKAVIAGHIAARKIVEIFMQPMITISAACSTFVSQNYGADRFDRIKKAIKNSLIMELGLAVLFNIIVFAFAGQLIGLVTDTKNEIVLSTARQYLFTMLPFYTFLGVLYVLRTSIQSIGRRIPPLISSTIELGTKIVAAFVLTKAFGYTGACIAEPISWTLGALMLIGVFIASRKTLFEKSATN